MNGLWRLLPSRFMDSEQAFRTMLAGHVVGVAYCLGVRALPQKLCGINLGWIHNELGGADRSCIAKKAVIASIYLTFGKGAISVATSGAFTTPGL
ncbi:hypothetical protein K458DRAFT_453567 [Lentithecium fluviatile CBS 122367]|uniref:Uncharacterized protein n=1 Tax=Lentithecium fluviatile CBS 122367 TaxID=1168545 RepID=A0A6G1IYV1_9PLEO|nr:hypothetical protein K458DRAFT_453567 [Lentithecium fluviatile CBS 122367]